MANQTLSITEPLHDYLLSVSLREDEHMARLRAETAKLSARGMQMAPEQA